MEITYPMKGKNVSQSPREVCFVVTFTIAQDDVSFAGKLRQFWRRVGIEGRSRYIRLLLVDYQHSLLAVSDIYVIALFRKHWLHGQYSNRTPMQEECS